MNQLISSIEKASAIAGSDYKLAQMLEVSRQKVSNWRNNHQPCPPEEQAMIAAIAGENPTEALIDAIIRKNEGKPKAARLRALFGRNL